MNRSLLRRLSTILVVAVLLSTPAWAGGGTRLEPSPGLFATVWQLLGSWLTGTTAAGSDGRIGMNPNGLTAPTTGTQTATDGDGRATLDPNG
jgi:hypothetical protein